MSSTPSESCSAALDVDRSRPAGVLIAWCREAKVEFGEAVASRLKLSRDGTKVLWPQPSDDPEDPQNVR